MWNHRLFFPKTAGNLSRSRLPKNDLSLYNIGGFLCRKAACHCARQAILCWKRPVTLQNNGGVYHNDNTANLSFRKAVHNLTNWRRHSSQPNYGDILLLFFFLPTDAGTIAGFYCGCSTKLPRSFSGFPSFWRVFTFFFSYSASYLFLIALLKPLFVSSLNRYQQLLRGHNCR